MVSKWVITPLYPIYKQAIYNPFTDHLLTSWDIQVEDDTPHMLSCNPILPLGGKKPQAPGFKAKIFFKGFLQGGTQKTKLYVGMQDTWRIIPELGYVVNNLGYPLVFPIT